MPSSLPFWDPGAFAGPTTTNPDIWPAVRTSLPEDEGGLQPGLSPWEVVYFAKRRAPGLARVYGGKKRIVDPRQIPGSSGQIPAVMSYLPAEFRVTLVMWTPDQWADFCSLAQFLFPKPVKAPTPVQQFGTPVLGNQSAVPNSPTLTQTQGGSVIQTLTAVDVIHPAFQCLGITSLYVIDIQTPVPSAIPGALEATIDLIEFVPPYNEGVTPIQSSVSEVSPGVFSPPGTRAPPPAPVQTDVGATAGGPP